MKDFLRIHIVNIYDLQFWHSKDFRFRNRREINQYTNVLILKYHASVYLRFEDEFNKEKLKIKVSWTLLIFFVSFLLLPASFLVGNKGGIVLLSLSLIFFLIALLMRDQYRKFAFNIDMVQFIATEDLVEEVRNELEERSGN